MFENIYFYIVISVVIFLIMYFTFNQSSAKSFGFSYFLLMWTTTNQLVEQIAFSQNQEQLFACVCFALFLWGIEKLLNKETYNIKKIIRSFSVVFSFLYILLVGFSHDNSIDYQADLWFIAVNSIISYALMVCIDSLKAKKLIL